MAESLIESRFRILEFNRLHSNEYRDCGFRSDIRVYTDEKYHISDNAEGRAPYND